RSGQPMCEKWRTESAVTAAATSTIPTFSVRRARGSARRRRTFERNEIKKRKTPGWTQCDRKSRRSRPLRACDDDPCADARLLEAEVRDPLGASPRLGEAAGEARGGAAAAAGGAGSHTSSPALSPALTPAQESAGPGPKSTAWGLRPRCPR